MAVEVVVAQLDDAPVIRNLMQLYLYDFSEITGHDVDGHGLFRNRWLDHYWTDDWRHPYLFRAGAGHWLGFGLVRAGDDSLVGADCDMSEFFVLRRYRRDGVGRDAAHQLFDRHPGVWQIREMADNTGAIAFWRTVIPAEHEELAWHEGPMQRFRWPA